MQTEMATREKLFTMRMTEEESAQMEAVARRYGMSVAAVVRMLIEREAAEMGREADTTSDPFATRDDERWKTFLMILRAIDAEGGAEPAAADDVVRWLGHAGYRNDWRGWKSFPAMLNALRRGGYIAKRLGGYTPTAKGAAFCKENAGRH